MRRAHSADVPVLLDLMEEFYAESGYTLDRPHASEAFHALLADERLGAVWILEDAGAAAGHAVVTFRFGMEFGGLIAHLDDLFVRPAVRNRGLARAALLEIRDWCAAGGIRALSVEVGTGNAPAQAVYHRAGFQVAPDRSVLYLELAPPTGSKSPQTSSAL